jgi:myo-inositol catabolism protein IolC
MFNEFKNKVLNLFSATNKYNENLLIEIENNYMNSIDENLLNENLN